jgi:integrase/recombinase XerD
MINQKKYLKDHKLEVLSNKYISLNNNSSEENIKIFIVIPILNLLGYNNDWFDFEFPTLNNGRSDIAIKLPNSNEILYIETKRKDYDLKSKDISQLIGYMVSNNMSWGIITNGNKFMLVNKDIKGDAKDKVVIEYYLDVENLPNEPKKTNNFLFKFLSYDKLFKQKSTIFFSYYKDFILNNQRLSKGMSTFQYQSAIFSFIDYLDETERICDNNCLSPTRLENYLTDLTSNKLYSMYTLINKGRYILSFLKYLENSEMITTKNFSNYNVEKFVQNNLFNKVKQKADSFSPITTEEIKYILDYYTTSRSNPYRNKLLFLLYLYIAPSMDVVKNLKVSDFKETKAGITLTLDNIKILLPDSLAKCYKEYMHFRIENNINYKYLFYTFYRKQFNQFSNTSIDAIINQTIKNIPQITEKRKHQLNVANIQKSVLTQMIDNGFTIEEIHTFTGISFSTLKRYVSNEIMNKSMKSASKKLCSNKHPYNDILS